MTPGEYEAWYHTPRGRWIADHEYRLLRSALDLPAGASVLDAGCGTGYFTRRLANDGYDITGIDTDAAMLGYARDHGTGRERYLAGDMRRLAFADRSFDGAIAITSLCFVREEQEAIAELARISRHCVALGLLNRHSLLWWRKGRGGGRGGYHGARWHTTHEARALLERAGLLDVVVHCAIQLPGGGRIARLVEGCVPDRMPYGGFLLAVGRAELPPGGLDPARQLS